MIRKLLVAGVLIAGVVALGAGTAFAHVEIEREGEVGSDGVVTAQVTVPNEEANAATTSLELDFPETPALTSATTTAVPGWTAAVRKNAAGNVTAIVWTGGPLTGDNKVVFPFTVGAVPTGTKTVEFKALQTYDNGDVVRWIEPTPANGEEPEHPAPVLTVTGKQPVDDDAAATPANGSDHSDAAATTSHSDSDDGMSTGAIIAIVIGALIVIALVIWLIARSRRGTKTPTA